MPLSEHQEKRLVDWCMSHGVRAACPFCGKNDWSTGEVVLPSIATTKDSSGTRESSAMVQIICDHCHLVMLFDGRILAEPQ